MRRSGITPSSYRHPTSATHDQRNPQRLIKPLSARSLSEIPFADDQGIPQSTYRSISMTLFTRMLLVPKPSPIIVIVDEPTPGSRDNPIIVPNDPVPSSADAPIVVIDGNASPIHKLQDVSTTTLEAPLFTPLDMNEAHSIVAAHSTNGISSGHMPTSDAVITGIDVRPLLTNAPP